VLGKLYRKLGSYGVEVLFGIKKPDDVPPPWQQRYVEVEAEYWELASQLKEKNRKELLRETQTSQAIYQDADQVRKILEVV
jgi:hypothetical protein